jgi:hypothetical protein
MGDDDPSAEVARLRTVTQAAPLAGVWRDVLPGWMTRGQLAAVRIAHRRSIRPAAAIPVIGGEHPLRRWGPNSQSPLSARWAAPTGSRGRPDPGGH